jgi:hypothetical protein
MAEQLSGSSTACWRSRFVFLLHDAEKFVGAQPKRLPNKIILARYTNCFFAREIEFVDRRLWTAAILALVLGAAIEIVSWQYECGEKGDGEREYEDHQIYKSAKKEFENTEEPALAINIPDGQENLRDKRDP